MLRLEGERGDVGWGEAAPLPGFSRESLEEASNDLCRRAEQLTGAEVMDSVIDDALRRHSDANRPPSVQFAVSSAITELWADRWDSTVASVLGGGAQAVPLSALIRDDETALTDCAERYRASGFRAVKLKVGRRSVEEDAKRVRTLSSILGNEVSLRLDANRAWTYKQAASFAEAIGDVPVEYLEEPLNEPDRLSAFADDTGIPVALDETTREVSPRTLSERSGVAAVVLKPTLLGDIRFVQRWVTYAMNVGITPVFSAAYESGVGTRMLIALASVLSEAPAGLSTYTRLASDLLSPRLSLDGAEASQAEGYEATVNQDRLEPVN